MGNKCNFIKTHDSKIAEILRNSGYTELTETGSKYFCFVNDGNMNFDESKIEQTKLKYTNVLCI